MKKVSKFILSGTLLICGILTMSFTLQEEIKGWFLAGNSPESYEIGIEYNAERNGKVAYMKSTQSKIKGFGTMMQSFVPNDYLGKTVKLSGYIKSKDVIGWSGMWMRIDGAICENKKSKMLGFDNMEDRPIKGTTKWTLYEIVLEVPTEAKNISYGVLTSGTGVVWMDDFKFEIVDKSTLTSKRQNSLNLDKPTNTSFEEN
jgi:hypothetical protein